MINLNINSRLRRREVVRYSRPVREKYGRTRNFVGPFTLDAPVKYERRKDAQYKR